MIIDNLDSFIVVSFLVCTICLLATLLFKRKYRQNFQKELLDIKISQIKASTFSGSILIFYCLVFYTVGFNYIGDSFVYGSDEFFLIVLLMLGFAWSKKWSL